MFFFDLFEWNLIRMSNKCFTVTANIRKFGVNNTFFKRDENEWSGKHKNNHNLHIIYK